MRKTLLFFLATVVCYILARLFVAHRGYVLLSWGPYTLESSLWSFLFVLIILILAVCLVIGVIRLLCTGISLFYPVTRKARGRKALAQATRGMVHYANGRWHSAQRLLAQAADAGQAPLITYLAAARAAHQDGNNEAFAECLRKADKVAPGADLAIGITRAELLLGSGQREQALATLKSLHKKSPSHTHVLKLLKKSYLELKDWNALARLLPELRKRKIISHEEHEHLHNQIYKALFEQAYQAGKHRRDSSQRLQPVHAVWKSLSYHYRKEERLICEYANVLVKLGEEKEAEHFIRQQFPQKYSQKLMALYGKLTHCDRQLQLSTSEGLLSLHPSDPTLLLGLAKICMRCDLPGKAHEYLDRCMDISPSAEAANLMGQLFAGKKLYQKSVEYYQMGANLSKSKEGSSVSISI